MSDVLRPSRAARSIEPTMIRSLRAGMRESTIDFGLGQTDLEISEAVREAIGGGDGREPYTPNAGSREAREAIAAHADADADEVMLTCGVQEGLAVAILGLCNPGDEVLVPNPGFPAYDNLVRAAGATPVRYPLAAPTPDSPGWGLDVEAVVERIGDATRLAVLNNPSNPTGSVFDADRLEALLTALEDAGVGWISDEIYEDYVWEGPFVSTRSINRQAGLVLSGLSKTHHMMGWRLGWMVGPAAIIEALTPFHQHLVTCAPSPAQRAAIAAVAEHDEAVVATREVFADRRRRVLEAFESIELGSEPSVDGAFYLFVDVRPWLSQFDTTLQLARALLHEEDVMVVPGEGFGPAGLGHLRVAFTIGGDALEEGLRRMVDFLQRHR